MHNNTRYTAGQNNSRSANGCAAQDDGSESDHGWRSIFDAGFSIRDALCSMFDCGCSVLDGDCPTFDDGRWASFDGACHCD
ncbi:MAG: hypothetical protein ACYTBJ_21895 [Planctomycetota bacterium]|jgi:hypothetical protein